MAKFDDLSAFAAVVRVGSFTRAAAQLGVTQSALSQARFVVYRFPMAPSKSAHNRTYEGYTKHEPKITKSRTIDYWFPKLSSRGRFGAPTACLPV